MKKPDPAGLVLARLIKLAGYGLGSRMPQPRYSGLIIDGPVLAVSTPGV